MPTSSRTSSCSAASTGDNTQRPPPNTQRPPSSTSFSLLSPLRGTISCVLEHDRAVLRAPGEDDSSSPPRRTARRRDDELLLLQPRPPRPRRGTNIVSFAVGVGAVELRCCSNASNGARADFVVVVSRLATNSDVVVETLNVEEQLNNKKSPAAS